MRFPILLLLSAAALVALTETAPAQEAPLVARVVNKLPRTEAEVVAAHDAAEADYCQEIKPGEPLEILGFTQRIGYKVSQGEGDQRKRTTVPFETSRRSVLSLGLGMTSTDRAELPALSGGTIQQRVDGNYIGIQVRVQRASESSTPYLYYRPQAFVGSYTSPKKTQDFADLMRTSILDMRSLGMFVEPNVPVTAEQLRTLVVLHKSLVIDEAKPEPYATKPVYELLCFRAREAQPADKNAPLELHAFATSHQRTRLHYFPPYRTPAKVDACHIESTIVITAFGFGGLAPTERATRQAAYRSQAQFPLADLHRYVAEQKLPGDAFDHLTLVLDAIIDGRVKPARAHAWAPGGGGPCYWMASP